MVLDRSLLLNTATRICGYFLFSSKPALDAAAAVGYSDFNLPSTSSQYKLIGITSAVGCSVFFVISAACIRFVGCARSPPLKFSAIFSGLLNRNLVVSIFRNLVVSIFALFSLFDSTLTFLAYVVLVLVLVFVFTFVFLGILKSPFTSFSINGVVW